MAAQPIGSFEIDIPRRVIVPCPARSFANRRAADACPRCPFYGGVMFTQDRIVATWPHGFRIVCGHPIARRVAVLEEEE